MLYDFKCRQGHMFEHTCKMDDRLNPIPCEGIVDNMAAQELQEKFADNDDPLPEGFRRSIMGLDTKIIVFDTACGLEARVFTGTHNNPAGCLDHGLGSNRDAAREGRYDPLNPNRRFMAKGRGYRK